MTRVSWRDILRVSQGQAERRDTLRAPSEQLVAALVGSERVAGVAVTPEAALAHADAYACIRVLSDATGSLPLVVYRRTPEGRVRDQDSIAALLLRRPSPTMTPSALWGTVMAHLQGWGNAFIAKFRAPGGLVVQLGVIHPSRVSVSVVAGEPRFLVQPHGVSPGGEFTRRDVIHIKGMSVDGVVGLSPIGQARRAIGVGVALEDAAAQLLANDSRPGGVLKTDRVLSTDAAKRLKAAWEALTSGANRGRVAVLEDGVTYEPMTLAPKDAEWVAQAKLSATRIARVFRVPPYMIAADTGSSLTYSTVEQEATSFVMHSLRPWLVAIEQSVAADEDLFGDPDLYPEFLIDALLRGDTAARYAAYDVAVGRFITVNEARRLENLNALPGGDDLAAPTEVVPA